MSGLLPVDDALAQILDGVEPNESELVPLQEAGGRVLATSIEALRTQPPFDASAMDGYAVRSTDVGTVPARLVVIGTAAAGKLFSGTINPGEAVRIFTGAPVPSGADTIAIQENVTPLENGVIEVTETVAAGRHIRRRGLDFAEGDMVLEAGRLLDPAALSLAASANHPALPLVRRPMLAIIATGDELLPPGSTPGPDQIIASNGYGVAAMATQVGARVLDLGIVPDRLDAISASVQKALDARADVIVTLGGASVGDHDLVHKALMGIGMEPGFWKIAMRPGKPLMFGRLGNTRCLGLPGNPVASLICSQIFLLPLLARLGGRTEQAAVQQATLGAPMAENDLRQDYVRATVETTASGLVATPLPVQDSSMLRFLAAAGGLIIRDPFAPAARAGDPCNLMLLR